MTYTGYTPLLVDADECTVLLYALAALACPGEKPKDAQHASQLVWRSEMATELGPLATMFAEARSGLL